MQRSSASEEAARSAPGVRVRSLAFGLLLTFAAVPLVASNLWGYLDTRAALTEAAYSNTRNVAALEATQAHDFIVTRRDLVPSIIAGNQHLFDELRRWMERSSAPSAGLKARQRLADHLAAKAAQHDRAEEFLLLDSSGGFVASSAAEGLRSGDLAARPCAAGLERGAVTVSLLYGGAEPTMVVSAPVMDDSGQELGSLCGLFPFEVHHLLVDAGVSRSSGAVLYLLDSGGLVACGSQGEDGAGIPGAGQRGGAGERRGVERHGIPVLLDGLPARVSAKGWQGRYENEDGREVIVAFEPLPELGGGVLVEVPVAFALASLHQLLRRVTVLSLLFVLLLLGAALAVARRLDRPISELSAAAGRMAGGELGTEVIPSGPRELADLALAFNRMALQVRESHGLLEQRIQERTRELERSQGFVELLFDSMEQAVLVFDRTHRVVKHNARATSYWGKEPLGCSCSESCGSALAPCEGCPVAAAFRDRRPIAVERSQQIGEVTEIVRIEAHPVFGRDGGVEAVMEVVRVVTDEKQMTAQLLYQEKMAAFGLVTAGIAHEIGNPLAAIATQLRIGRDVTDPARVREILALVESHVSRMSKLLREVVDFARRKRDTAVLLSVNQIVQDVGRMLGHDPRSRGLRIDFKLDPELPGLRAREDPIVQILLNLGINALDSVAEGGEAGGTVCFETSASGEGITVRIRDTGPGVPAERRQRIFEPFWTSKPRGRGTGLGLFLSRDVARSLGGRLTLESGASGACCFRLDLPPDEPRHLREELR